MCESLLRTVHRQIAQRRTGCSLHLGVMAAEEEEDGIKSVSTNWPDFLLGDFSESKGGTALQVDIVGKREGCQRVQW